MGQFLTKHFAPIMAILLVLLAIFGTISIRLHLVKTIPYKPQLDNITICGIDMKEPELTNEEIIVEINKLYGNPRYKLSIKSLKDRWYLGRTWPLFCLIEIDKTLTKKELVWVLAHELSHYTEFTGNERYVRFHSFKKLYESGNDWFKKVALDMVIKNAQENEPHYKSFVSKRYAINRYVQEYLLEKGENYIKND